MPNSVQWTSGGNSLGRQGRSCHGQEASGRHQPSGIRCCTSLAAVGTSTVHWRGPWGRPCACLMGLCCESECARPPALRPLAVALAACILQLSIPARATTPPQLARWWRSNHVMSGCAEPGSIRGDFCIDVGRNVIHGSDAVESAQREIGLWFPEGLADNKPMLKWIYE